jgi:hypothetical protein
MVKIIGSEAVGNHIIKKIQEKKNVMSTSEVEKCNELNHQFLVESTLGNQMLTVLILQGKYFVPHFKIEN